MKTAILAGVAILALSLSTAADAYVQQGKDSGVMQEQAREGGKRSSGHVRGGHGAHRPQVQVRGGQHRRGHNWGPRVQGRWHAGHQAPGGWNSYQRPVIGYQLPRYWVNPSYYIVNYANYGFQAPQQGYQWVRYYDDAVLTDQNGYVAYAQPNVQWEQYGDTYADAEYGESVVVDDNVSWEEDGSVYANTGPTPAPYGTTYEQPAYTYQPVSNAPAYDPCEAGYQASGQVYDRSGRPDCATQGKGYSKGYTKGAQVEYKQVEVHVAAPQPQPQYQPGPQVHYQPAPQPQATYYPGPQPQYRPAPPHHGGQMVMQPAYYPAQQPMYYMVYPQVQQSQPASTTVVVNAGGSYGGSYTETTTTVTETEYYETTPKKKRPAKRKPRAKAKPSCRCS